MEYATAANKIVSGESGLDDSMEWWSIELINPVKPVPHNTTSWVDCERRSVCSCAREGLNERLAIQMEIEYNQLEGNRWRYKLITWVVATVDQEGRHQPLVVFVCVRLRRMEWLNVRANWNKLLPSNVNFNTTNHQHTNHHHQPRTKYEQIVIWGISKNSTEFKCFGCTIV